MQTERFEIRYMPNKGAKMAFVIMKKDQEHAPWFAPNKAGNIRRFMTAAQALSAAERLEKATPASAGFYTSVVDVPPPRYRQLLFHVSA